MRDYLIYKRGKTWFEAVNLESDKMPLILAHGGPGFTSYYLEPFKEISKEIPIVLYDQQGCGRSSKIDLKNANIKFYVKELEALRKKLKIKKFYLLGHSWGAALALEYYKHYSKRVEKIIFASPFISSRYWQLDILSNVKTLQNNVRDKILNVIDNKDYYSANFLEAVNSYNKNFIYRSENKPFCLLEAETNSSSDIYIHMWGLSEFIVNGTLKNFDNSKYLKKVKIPCLFTAGQYDESSLETLIYYKSLVKSKVKDIKIYEHSAHHPHIEDNKLYINDILSFLKSRS